MACPCLFSRVFLVLFLALLLYFLCFSALFPSQTGLHRLTCAISNIVSQALSLLCVFCSCSHLLEHSHLYIPIFFFTHYHPLTDSFTLSHALLLLSPYAPILSGLLSHAPSFPSALSLTSICSVSLLVTSSCLLHFPLLVSYPLVLFLLTSYPSLCLSL